MTDRSQSVPAPSKNTQIRTYALTGAGAATHSWEPAAFPAPAGQGFLWFDVTDPTPQGLEALQRQYHLHPLAIEDTVHAHQRAKVETYPEFEFIVAHGVTRSRGGDVDVHELNVFAGEFFVISVRHGSGPSVEEILQRWERVPAAWRTDSSSLVYVLLDALVDGYCQIVVGVSFL